MSKQILRLPQVQKKTGLSRSSIYSFIKIKKFPAPIVLGLRSVGWLEESIDKWIDSKSKRKEEKC